MGSQFVGHRRADAEPAFEAGHGLVKQHAEPIDGAIVPAARRGEKAGFERAIYEIGDRGVGRQQREIEVESLPTPDAVERFGELDPARTAAALHLTC